MRQLFFSNGSPYARKVRIVLHEKGLEYAKDIYDAVRPIEAIKPLNPNLAVTLETMIGLAEETTSALPKIAVNAAA